MSIAIAAMSIAIAATSNAIAATSIAIAAMSNVIAAMSNAIAATSNAIAATSIAIAALSNAIAALSNAIAALSIAIAALSNAIAAMSNAIAATSIAIAALSNAIAALSNAIAALSNAIAATSIAIAAMSNAFAALSNAIAAMSNAIAALSNAIAASSKAIAASSKAIAASSIAIAAMAMPASSAVDFNGDEIKALGCSEAGLLASNFFMPYHCPIFAPMTKTGNFQHAGNAFQLGRYPHTDHTSLQAWCSADELLLQWAGDYHGDTAIYGDTFGTLAVCLSDREPLSVLAAQSQQKALRMNALANGCSEKVLSVAFPLGALPAMYQAMLIRVPKSLDLFELYLRQASVHLINGGSIACGFMTKYFTSGMLEIAQKYFAQVEQSQAHRKARLLILSSPRVQDNVPLIHTIQAPWGQELKQYYGVFSSGHVDYASQFLIDNLTVAPHELQVLDLASGNGVLAAAALRSNPAAYLTLMDDSWLAIQSSMLNLPDGAAQFVWDDTLIQLGQQAFDLIITNPPFHFGHETNIEVSLSLFAQASQCLRPKGRLVVVANRHLNYATHLQRMFRSVSVLNENEKFVIYESRS